MQTNKRKGISPITISDDGIVHSQQAYPQTRKILEEKQPLRFEKPS